MSATACGAPSTTFLLLNSSIMQRSIAGGPRSHFRGPAPPARSRHGRHDQRKDLGSGPISNFAPFGLKTAPLVQRMKAGKWRDGASFFLSKKRHPFSRARQSSHFASIHTQKDSFPRSATCRMP
jgi:hypothetical protein